MDLKRQLKCVFILDKNLLRATNICFLCRGVPGNRFVPGSCDRASL